MALTADLDPEFSDFGFAWLFDPNDLAYLPIEEQLKHYKQRQLFPNLYYRVASKSFGAPVSRRRVIIAPPMSTADDGVRELKQPFHASLNPPPPPTKTLEEEVKEIQKELYIREQECKEWVAKRQTLRQDLNKLGLNQSWLARKPDRTGLESRVLGQLKVSDRQRQQIQAQEAEEIQVAKPKVKEQQRVRSPTPTVASPSPEAMRVIDKYVRQHKLRLLDFFMRFDKNKQWLVSREDFKKVIKLTGVPISDHQLEDLMVMLDQDGNEKIDYRELVQGRHKLHDEDWDALRSQAQSRLTRSEENLAAGKHRSTHGGKKRSTSAQVTRVHAPSYKTPEKTAQDTGLDRSRQTMGSSSSSLLEVPPVDTTETVPLSSEVMLERRKREKQWEKKEKQKKKKKRQQELEEAVRLIRTGNVAVDNHSLPSSMTGEMGAAVDRYRQQRLREYNQICRLCKESGTALSSSLLERVLLHPGDRLLTGSTTALRQPGLDLLSKDWAKTPAAHKAKKKEDKAVKHQGDHVVKRTKQGTLLVDSRHVYPMQKRVGATGQRMSLSTGKANISRVVDCWMTFEEYEQLTRTHKVRFKKLVSSDTPNASSVDDNAFWPGHLLDKLRLCMCPEDKPPAEPHTLFHNTQNKPPTNWGYENKETWPVSDRGYIQYGHIETDKEIRGYNL
ncbi:PREDICTED: EF-hand calcium-binding domain-containing protein 12-like [Branchiostoma belcheri]|uniref:EF-hand calcium-binding domain-containing protein 12-like n=1 Tax=Branchiostoma belcheri TaxID=7741 RepID=A0A6P4ZWX9_BRABE|nr:PREDICTED: EF-hand calcium-binding domain-containing protein 12-like [Branchiostoma belcheri]